MNFIIKLLLFQLFIFQILDGFFTYLGVSNFGVIVEGNPIVKNIMILIGIVPGLLLVKGACCIFCLIMMSDKLLNQCDINAAIVFAYCLVAALTLYLFVLIAWCVILVPIYAQIPQ